MASTSTNNNACANSQRAIYRHQSSPQPAIFEYTCDNKEAELPKSFIAAMRTLFDIMAEERTGYVRFTDIEKRWQEGSAGMPEGVIESLRKVTSPNGLLSFRRFCEGLKICLLKNQQDSNITSMKRRVIGESSITGSTENYQNGRRPPSAPLLENQWPSPKPIKQATAPSTSISYFDPPSLLSHRALSMPQLSPERGTNINGLSQSQQTGESKDHNIYALGPPKPPRSLMLSAPAIPDRLDRAEIRNALQNWQLGVMEGNKKKSSEFFLQDLRRSVGDGQPDLTYPKRTNIVKRKEPRRHTLQNGIDYNILKRMKQIEQERDILLQGLAILEKARDWYLKQVAIVQDKMKYLGHTGSVELWTDTQQERIDLQRARIMETNRHLSALCELDNFPVHMNLALPTSMYQYSLPSGANRHKQRSQHIKEESSNLEHSQK